MTEIYTPKTPQIVRVPNMGDGERGDITITEETADLNGVPVVLFSSPGKVGVYVTAADLVSGEVTHQDAYQAVLNGNSVSSPNLTMQ